VVERGHPAQPAVRIRHERVRAALHEGHVHLAAQQALQVLDRARGAAELHAQSLAGETALVLAAEAVVGAARLAGGQHDAIP